MRRLRAGRILIAFVVAGLAGANVAAAMGISPKSRPSGKVKGSAETEASAGVDASVDARSSMREHPSWQRQPPDEQGSEGMSSSTSFDTQGQGSVGIRSGSNSDLGISARPGRPIGGSVGTDTSVGVTGGASGGIDIN